MFFAQFYVCGRFLQVGSTLWADLRCPQFAFLRCRVLRRAGIAGILPAGVWLCRLRRKFGRFLPAGKFCWFSFLPAGDHRASLKRLKELEHSRFPFSFCSSKRRGDPRVASKRTSWARRLGASRTAERRSRKPRRCVSNHVQVTQNGPRHFRSTQYWSVLHVATRCMLSRSRSRSSSLSDSEQDWSEEESGRHRWSWNLPKCESGRRFVDRERRILQTLSSRVLSSSRGRCVRLLQVTFLAQSDRTGFSSSFLLSANVENFAYLRRLEND